LPNPSPALAIPNPEPPEKEETPISDFMLEFEDECFDEHGGTSNYHIMRRPQKPRKSSSMKKFLTLLRKLSLKRLRKS
jgi:hypothetical protein